MTYTNLGLTTEVGNQFDSQASTRVQDWVNDAITDIFAMRDWSFAETLAIVASVSGQQDYIVAGTSAVIPDFQSIITVKHNTAAGSVFFPKLAYLKQNDFDEMYGVSGVAAGVPAAYTLRGSTAAANAAAVAAGGTQVMSVYPVPNYVGSFRIAYFRNFGSIPMSATTDVPALPAQFRTAIVQLAISIGKARTDQYIASNVALQLAMQSLQSLERADVAARGGDLGEQPTILVPKPGIQPGTNPYSG